MTKTLHYYKNVKLMTLAASLFLLIASSGCSAFSGNSYSDDPAVAAQQRRVQQLKAEVKEQEQYTKQAKEREDAAKARLKAAEHELKALQSEAKQRSSYQ